MNTNATGWDRRFLAGRFDGSRQFLPPRIVGQQGHSTTTRKRKLVEIANLVKMLYGRPMCHSSLLPATGRDVNRRIALAKPVARARDTGGEQGR
jgi:hypothetical protein